MFSNNPDLSFVPFHWTHAYHMDLRPFDSKAFQTVPNYKQMLEYYTQMPHAYTGIYQGQMAYSFGPVMLHPGVVELWMLSTYHVERMPISLTKASIRYCNHIARDMQLHRLQITVEVQNSFAVRWASALQFTCEGRLKNYGPDKNDFFIYARLI